MSIPVSKLLIFNQILDNLAPRPLFSSPANSPVLHQLSSLHSAAPPPVLLWSSDPAQGSGSQGSGTLISVSVPTYRYPNLLK